MSTITLTFGDQAENHVGMQQIGQIADSGFDLDDLLESKKIFDDCGFVTELINLHNYVDQTNITPAYILIIRDGVDMILGENNYCADDMLLEQSELEPDKQAKMYGRIVNKTARYNLCFSEISQEADYINGKGTIIAYDDVPILKFFREKLPEYFGTKSTNLQTEGNYYYDIENCGIGFHGDSERRRVIGVRLGETIPLHYQWFQNGNPIGTRIKLKINHGDIYVMSEKAVGTDWKRKITKTLRHAAGAKKFLTIKK